MFLSLQMSPRTTQLFFANNVLMITVTGSIPTNISNSLSL